MQRRGVLHLIRFIIFPFFSLRECRIKLRNLFFFFYKYNVAVRWHFHKNNARDIYLNQLFTILPIIIIFESTRTLMDYWN